MNNVINIRIDRVYGKCTIYPANEQAELLAKIAGTKTLTNSALQLAEQMGFTIMETMAAKTQYGYAKEAVSGAIAALSQNANFPADIALAKSLLGQAEQLLKGA